MASKSSSHIDFEFIVKIVCVARNWRDIEFHRFLRAHMKLCVHIISFRRCGGFRAPAIRNVYRSLVIAISAELRALECAEPFRLGALCYSN